MQDHESAAPFRDLEHLFIHFEEPLPPYQTNAFRGAIIEHVGREHDWFHNHNNDDEDASPYYYRYPLVQYKSHQGRPVMLYLGKGVHEAYHFFNQSNFDLTINGEAYPARIGKLDIKQFTMQAWDQSFEYNIFEWLALNKDHVADYRRAEAEGLVAKLQFLEKRLVTHLLGFAKGIDWNVQKQITVQILDIRREHYIRYKNAHLLSINLRFRTNIFIPDFVGLGKGVAKGFGMVRKMGR